ncbi:2,3-bisphosphoglycerate-independent phosphoglycerate mutase [Natronospirillum operosum]|uniref:2,3-bisphosphoglycerate-independent phosphoglycerate mutase n=1 Tax=Natronospirillum operosum TaxID=2759953 RepID=A0A4Z0W5J5_9GAMM|nr:2,3-bisphosphoglycerate-independent phosphoglycerate mutase [Natronospirillum operosum]TGG92360.1 2,3-bisphosphoglycerate-independent phosphoglycerate mutase [Natronospirillum operosum]
MSAQKKTVALIILDGFGYSETSKSNAIEQANTPTWDRLWSEYPHALVKTSGLAVGLPEGQMGNSEVGHMNLGAGRIVYQNFTRISKDIEDGQFPHNEALVNAVEAARAKGGKVHILGLASPGGVHSHEDHLIAMMDVAAKRGVEVCVHAFLDGRDTPPRSAEATLKRLQAHADTLGVQGVVSLIGRYYAMDRDNRWERVQQAYDLLTQGKAEIVAADPVAGLHAAYEQDKDDEFVPATSIRSGDDPAVIADGDSVVFMNFRPDRARELTRAFVDNALESDLDRSVRPQLADFVTLTEYAADIKASCAYPPTALKNTLGEYLADRGKTQLRIAETEKYAHVTFFFNGGEEKQYKGEDRILVPSPRVATYDLQPEMSAPEVTEKLTAAIRSGKYDLVVCNYANGDMVGHTGNMDAAIKAVETLDWALKEVTDAIIDVDGQCLITADHGNVELMVNPETGGAVTSHTVFPVPLVYVSKDGGGRLKDGRLCDLAPTLLHMMGDEQPAEMTGDNLLG